MDEVRKNNEKEEAIARGTFKISPGAVLGWLISSIFVALFIGLDVFFCCLDQKNAQANLFATMPMLIILGIVFIVVNVFGILSLVGIHKSELEVTNKTISGKVNVIISRKTFSYRLDEIDNVEMNSTLGQHTLMINFSQGNGPSGTPIYSNGVQVTSGAGCLRITNLKNYIEIYEALNNLIKQVKNKVDVDIDLKKSSIAAENRKADALEKMATGATAVSSESPKSSTSYIEELKELKKLLDDGIITQEEFDQEKKEILDNNHR